MMDLEIKDGQQGPGGMISKEKSWSGQRLERAINGTMELFIQAYLS